MPEKKINKNLPNQLTTLRAVLVIPFVLLVLIGKCEGISGIAAVLLFIAASITDALDGYIARRDHLVSDYGKLMDPLADKLLVSSALICLLAIGRLPAYVCLILILREFVISGFRLLAVEKAL